MNLAGNHNPLPALPGFNQVRRYWDPKFTKITARVNPGEIYVTEHEENIHTALGSCIAACIRDRNKGIGGMNHFMLPSGTSGSSIDKSCYGVAAMERLVNAIYSNGGKRWALEAKIFGGAELLGFTDGGVGAENVEFVRDFLEKERIPVVSEDVGGTESRQVIYFVPCGRALVKATCVEEVGKQQRNYQRELKQQEWSGDVELF
ncbi:MAG: chemoreceptor glutamine deamidase CheD [Myxococcota bacterium]